MGPSYTISRAPCRMAWQHAAKLCQSLRQPVIGAQIRDHGHRLNAGCQHLRHILMSNAANAGQWIILKTAHPTAQLRDAQWRITQLFG